MKAYVTGNVGHVPAAGLIPSPVLHNAGLGLYMVSRLSDIVGGEMAVASGRALYRRLPASELRSEVRGWPGTLVAVQFPLQLPGAFGELRRRVLPPDKGRQ